MKTLSRLIVFLTALVALFAAMTSTAFAAKLIYNDEFNGSMSSAWKPLTPWSMTQNPPELQYYGPSNLSFVNNGLRLTSNNVPTSGKNYSSGVITSLNRAEFGYGYFEMNAKLPKGQGIWPAFWMINNDCDHEIDVFELLGDAPNRVYMTYHYNDQTVYSASYTGPDFSAGYHTFAVDWQPGSITWYIDGVQRGKYTGTVSPVPLMICANTAVGGVWPGNPDGTTKFPQYYDIDYIRVYDSKPVPNTAPVAAANSYTTPSATQLTVAAPGVLGNDSDAQGDVLTASVVNQPANGSLTLNANGSFTYTPNAGFSGVDTFTYRAADAGSFSAAATVSITVVAPVVHAPTAAADSYSTQKDTALTIAAAGVLANDSDSQGHALTAAVAAQPAHGSVTLNADGSFTYVPAAGYAGSDSFTYTASDGGASSAAAKVSISVVDPAAANKRKVHRFLNKKTGVHFYTASDAEMASVSYSLASTYQYEGVAYTLDVSSPANSAPLYRFYDMKRGVHFYTASESEKATLIRTMSDVYAYDGVACNVSLASVGTQPVYRFYNMQKGVHFYTASPAERDSVAAKLSSVYKFEGVGYSFAPSL